MLHLLQPSCLYTYPFKVHSIFNTVSPFAAVCRGRCRISYVGKGVIIKPKSHITSVQSTLTTICQKEMNDPDRNKVKDGRTKFRGPGPLSPPQIHSRYVLFVVTRVLCSSVYLGSTTVNCHLWKFRIYRLSVESFCVYIGS